MSLPTQSTNDRPREPELIQIPLPLETHGTQVSDPKITGFDHKENQAGNAYVEPPRLSEGSAAQARNQRHHDKKKPAYTKDIKLSSFPSVQYNSLMRPTFKSNSIIYNKSYSNSLSSGNSNEREAEEVMEGVEEPRTRDSSIYVRPVEEDRTSFAKSEPGEEAYTNYYAYPDYDDETQGEDYGISQPVQRMDASTLTRPIGYRDLELYPRGEEKGKDAETQVQPMDLEKMAATLRGIILTPYDVLWPTNGEFTITRAERKIEEYIGRCWKMCPKWAFHVQYLHAIEECYRNKYLFQVKWSLPTQENPIPVATASVFFVFDVEIYAGRDETVKVHYVLEGNRFPHKPGEYPFQQKWISAIICEKMRLMRSIK